MSARLAAGFGTVPLISVTAFCVQILVAVRAGTSGNLVFGGIGYVFAEVARLGIGWTGDGRGCPSRLAFSKTFI